MPHATRKNLAARKAAVARNTKTKTAANGASAAKNSKSEQTRAQVLRAAIDCIYEEGFNAAHTNRIAARAGVSWGVLQYHFGDKTGLLQAVLDTIFAEFTETLRDTPLTEGDLAQRIETLIDVVWSLVSKREYRVSMAILRNAARGADASIDGDKMIEMWSVDIGKLWNTLFCDMDKRPKNSITAKRLMFATVRGLADEVNPEENIGAKAVRKELVALRDALVFLVEQ